MSYFPMTSGFGRLTLILAAVLVLGVLWHGVFAMTGVLWWNAPQDQGPLERPAPPQIMPPDSDWVDVEAYLRTHPVWQH